MTGPPGPECGGSQGVGTSLACWVLAAFSGMKVHGHALDGQEDGHIAQGLEMPTCAQVFLSLPSKCCPPSRLAVFTQRKVVTEVSSRGVYGS